MLWTLAVLLLVLWVVGLLTAHTMGGLLHILLVLALVVIGALGLWTPTQAVARSNNPAPKYKVDMLWPKPLPERWVTGEVAGTCVDANDHVFTVNRGPQNANLTAKEDLVAQASPPVIE